VDFELSEDQQALRDGAGALLDDLASPARVRAHVAGDEPFDRTLWEAMAAQGWPAVDTPEADGGLGLGMVEVTVLCEALGAHTAPVPFLGSVLARRALAVAVTAGHAQAGDEVPGTGLTAGEVLGALAEGACTGTVAWSRRADAVRARRAGSGWVVSGRADPVVDGIGAGVLVVFAGTDDGPGLFALAPPAGAGWHAEPAMDRTRTQSWLVVDDAPALALGGTDDADALWDRAATLAAAEMLGGARRAMEMAVAYAKDRVQFGRPIGSFQAVKHRCADMLVDVEGMHSSGYYAAWAVGADDPEAHAAASAAKVWCSDASARVMAGALQVHGGIGFTWEHDLHFYVKRAQLDRVRFGDATVHRERLAAILRPRAEKGEPVL
jgi:alkylation response protein AidB-like acyl-CoA dehydrogenase